MDKISLSEKFTRFDEHWSPKLIGELNGQYVKLAKGKGELVWHTHVEEDEFFLVISGRLHLHFRDRITTLNPGECCIVPRGIEHKPAAEGEVHNPALRTEVDASHGRTAVRADGGGGGPGVDSEFPHATVCAGSHASPAAAA